MSNSMRDENLPQDDTFIESDTDWNEADSEDIPQVRATSVSRNGPKWKAIEEYWEKKRLQDSLQDYLTEDE